MKIDSKLIYAVAGSVITLLFVFVFNVLFLSDNLVPTTQNSIALECPDQSAAHEYASNETKQQNEPVPTPVSNQVIEDRTEPEVAETFVKDECDEQCVNSLTSQLISGKNLGEDDGFVITSEQANKIADLIQTNPSKLSEFESTLSSLRGQDGRDSILYVFSRLPDDQVEEIARRLSSSDNTRNRVDAISLLSSISNRNPGVQDEIKQIINTEHDPDILLKAIKASHSLSPDNVDSTTRNRLSNLINTGSDEEIRSQALITKMNIVQSDSDLRNDVTTALTSGSTRFKQAGLQALDNVLAKQKNGENSDDWSINNELRLNVEKIANDPNADPRTRVEALNLIRRHYYNR